jgi:hypothetical protein
MVQSELFQYEQDIKWEDAGNGVQRQVFGYDDKVMLVKAKFINRRHWYAAQSPSFASHLCR